MRSLKVIGILLSIAFLAVAVAGETNSLGIRDVSRVSFVAPVRVGTTLLPAGEYRVRHTMQGEDHIMVFESVRTGTVEAKAKCNLVKLAQKASQTRTVYETNPANERVLRELEFRGDTAKHVFSE